MDNWNGLQILKSATSEHSVQHIFRKCTGSYFNVIRSPDDHFKLRKRGHQLIDYLPTHWAYAHYDGETLLIWDSLSQPEQTYSALAEAPRGIYVNNGQLYQLPTGVEVPSETSAQNVSTCGLWTCLAGILIHNSIKIYEGLKKMKIFPVDIDNSTEKTFNAELIKNENNFILRHNEIILQQNFLLFLNSNDIMEILK